VGLQNRPWDRWWAAALGVRRTSKIRSPPFCSCVHFSRAGAPDTTIAHEYNNNMVYAYYVRIHFTLCVQHTDTPMRRTRAPHRTRVAVVGARPGFEAAVRGSAALPASALKAPCAGALRGQEGAERPRMCLYTRVFTRYPAVRACAAAVSAMISDMASRRERGHSDGQRCRSGRVASGEKERGHDLLGVALGAHAPPVNKQRGGFSFSLFTSSSPRRYTHTQ